MKKVVLSLDYFFPELLQFLFIDNSWIRTEAVLLFKNKSE